MMFYDRILCYYDEQFYTVILHFIYITNIVIKFWFILNEETVLHSQLCRLWLSFYSQTRMQLFFIQLSSVFSIS